MPIHFNLDDNHSTIIIIIIMMEPRSNLDSAVYRLLWQLKYVIVYIIIIISPICLPARLLQKWVWSISSERLLIAKQL